MPATGYSLAELCAGCSRQPGQSKCPFPQESLDMLCGRTMTPSKMTAYSSFLKMPETQRLLAKVPQEVLCCLDDWEEQLCTSLASFDNDCWLPAKLAGQARLLPVGYLESRIVKKLLLQKHPSLVGKWCIKSNMDCWDGFQRKAPVATNLG
eukprot:s2924_g6.t3